MSQGIDSLVGNRLDAYGSDPQALMERFQMSGETVDLLALQAAAIVVNEAKTTMLANAETEMPNEKQALEQEVVEGSRNQILSQLTPGIRQQGQQLQEAAMQQQEVGVPQPGPRMELPGQSANNMMMAAQGGIVGYQEGGFLERMLEIDKGMNQVHDARQTERLARGKSLSDYSPSDPHNAISNILYDTGAAEFLQGLTGYESEVQQPETPETLEARELLQERYEQHPNFDGGPEHGQFIRPPAGQWGSTIPIGRKSKGPISRLSQVDLDYLEQQALFEKALEKVAPEDRELVLERKKEFEQSYPLGYRMDIHKMIHGPIEELSGGGIVGFAGPQGSLVGGGNMDALLDALMGVESGGNPNALGAAGEEGAYQIRPTTAEDPGYGVSPMEGDRFDPEASRSFARQYLQAFIDRYDGDIEAALIAYNAGATNADRFIAAGRDYSVLPQAAQTQPYVREILDQMEAQGREDPSRGRGVSSANLDAEERRRTLRENPGLGSLREVGRKQDQSAQDVLGHLQNLGAEQEAQERQEHENEINLLNAADRAGSPNRNVNPKGNRYRGINPNPGELRGHMAGRQQRAADIAGSPNRNVNPRGRRDFSTNLNPPEAQGLMARSQQRAAADRGGLASVETSEGAPHEAASGARENNGLAYLQDIGAQQEDRRARFDRAFPDVKPAVARAEQEKEDGGIGYLRRLARKQEGRRQEGGRAARYLAMMQDSQNMINAADPAGRARGQEQDATPSVDILKYLAMLQQNQNMVDGVGLPGEELEAEELQNLIAGRGFDNGGDVNGVVDLDARSAAREATVGSLSAEHYPESNRREYVGPRSKDEEEIERLIQQRDQQEQLREQLREAGIDPTSVEGEKVNRNIGRAYLDPETGEPLSRWERFGRLFQYDDGERYEDPDRMTPQELLDYPSAAEIRRASYKVPEDERLSPQELNAMSREEKQQHLLQHWLEQRPKEEPNVPPTPVTVPEEVVVEEEVEVEDTSIKPNWDMIREWGLGGMEATNTADALGGSGRAVGAEIARQEKMALEGRILTVKEAQMQIDKEIALAVSQQRVHSDALDALEDFRANQPLYYARLAAQMKVTVDEVRDLVQTGNDPAVAEAIAIVDRQFVRDMSGLGAPPEEVNIVAEATALNVGT